MPSGIERMVSGLVRQLESSGETEVATFPPSAASVMEALRGLDPVAYVRFASVYATREAADSRRCLSEIAASRWPTHAPSGHRPQSRFDSSVRRDGRQDS